MDEEAESGPPSKPKGKRKAVSVKKEEENTEVAPVPDSKDNVVEEAQTSKKKASKSSAKTKPQKGLLNFFGPKKS